MKPDPFDPRNRELCPDDACIGVIGANGRCKECGTIAPSAVTDPRHRNLVPERVIEEGEADASDEDRQLCPDGACIGLIGPDGRCKECGAAADESAAPPDEEDEEDEEDDEDEWDDDDEDGEDDDEDEDEEDEEEDDDEDADEEDDEIRAAAAADPDERRLCPDGACIGLIGPNNRCKECGTTADSAP